MSIVTVVTEGTTDTVVVRRICAEIGLEIAAVHGENGKHGLDKLLGGYNEAARRERWLILRDLDTDADCAPTLVKKLLPTPSRGMTFRIATRGIESWLLADATAFARFFSVSAGRLPRNPDSLLRPKTHLVNILRHSRSRAVREDIVPRDNSGAMVGPGYTSRLMAFVRTSWRPAEAGRRSDSLRRCIKRLSHLSRGAARESAP